jgi:hypothetical protein
MGTTSSTDSSTCTTVCPAGPQGIKGDKGDPGTFDPNALKTYTLYCDPNNDYCTLTSGKNIKGLTGISFGTNTSILNDYEEYVHKTQITGNGLHWDDISFYITKVGKSITMRMSSDALYGTATSGGYFQMTTNLPERFRPTNYFRSAWPIIDNNVHRSDGYIVMDVTGHTYWTSYQLNPMVTGHVNGITPGSITWTL